MQQIDSLTDEQWQRIYAARDEYIRIGTCTEPADRPMAEQAIRDMYSAIEKDEPRFIWVDGPLSMCVAGHLISNREQIKDQIGTQLWKHHGRWLDEHLRAQLWRQIGDPSKRKLESLVRWPLKDQLRDQVGSVMLVQLRGPIRNIIYSLRDCLDINIDVGVEQALDNQLWNGVGGQVKDQFGWYLKTQLRKQIKKLFWNQDWDQPGKQLWDQPGNQLWDQLQGSIYGQEQIWWAGHHLACSEIVGVDYTYEQSAKLDMWIRLSRSCGWWLPYEGVCIVSERHKFVSFDEERRLHCETGPATECRDGYKVYAWHGTNIPEEWIENRDSLDPSTALTWENIEQRRAAAEIIGWDRVIDQLENRLIDSDEDPMIGDLIEVDLPDAEATRFLRVRCGTGRTFAIPVPPEYNTALEANAATYGIDPSLLRQMDVRT